MRELLDQDLTTARAEDIRQLNGAVKLAIWGAERLEQAKDKNCLATAETTIRFMDTVEDTIEHVQALNNIHGPRGLKVVWLQRPASYGLRLQMNPDLEQAPDIMPADRGLVSVHDYERHKGFTLRRKPLGWWEMTKTMSVDRDTGRAMITGSLATLLVAGRHHEWSDTIQATEQEANEVIDVIEATKLYHYQWLAKQALKGEAFDVSRLAA
jgi:hypothetical protein